MCRWPSCPRAAITTTQTATFVVGDSPAHRLGQSQDFRPHLGGGQMHPLAVAGQHPLEAIVRQPPHRLGLLRPRVPAVVLGGRKRCASRSQSRWSPVKRKRSWKSRTQWPFVWPGVGMARKPGANSHGPAPSRTTSAPGCDDNSSRWMMRRRGSARRSARRRPRRPGASGRCGRCRPAPPTAARAA